MRATLTLPPVLDSARRARRFVERALGDAGIDGDHAWTVTLVAHELVTNAVQHARTDLDLRISVDDDTVHVEVRDDNPRRPLLTPAPRYATSGRGLELVSSLAGEWGVVADDVSKVVWAVVRRHDLTGSGTPGERQDGIGRHSTDLGGPPAGNLSLSA